MMNRTLRTTLLALIAIFLAQPAFAQFQGQIQMHVYGEEKGNLEVNEVNMFITKDRIFLKGQEEVNFLNSMDASGLLIRNDLKDFIVLMDGNNGLQVTKSEIEGLFDMFSMASGDDDTGTKVKQKGDKLNYRYTEKVRNILGYECSQLIIEDADDNGSYVSIWLTPNIDINWGILAEPWKNLPSDVEVSINKISQETIFTGKNFPLYIETYDNKTEMMKPVMEVKNINESNIAKAMVQVPSGVVLMGISEFMWKMMMNN